MRRVANPGRRDMEVPRTNEVMMRTAAVFVGRAVRGATPRHCRPDSSRNVALAVRRRPGGPTRESGSDGAQDWPSGQPRDASGAERDNTI